MNLITKSLDETEMAARDFAGSLSSMAKKGQLGEGAVVVGLYGDLGSGKTSFVQGVAKAFDIKGDIISPTFVIQKRYEMKNHSVFKNMVHIDAYRLEKPEEILPLGWHSITADRKNIIFVEWPEKIEPFLPKDHKKIIFEFVDPEKRSLEF